VPESVYSASEFDTAFFPIAKKDVYISGQYYGVPLEFDALALYVNEDILAENPDLKVPTTWDNLRQTAFKLTQRDARGQVTRGGVALGTTNNVDHFSDILGLMILQNGGDPGKGNAESVISALKFYSLFSKQDRSWSEDLPSSTLAFANGKVAMMLAPSWRALDVKQINQRLNFRLYPVPQLPGTNITWATYWIEGVAKKSQKQAAAWEFLKYLSSPETLTKMYQLAGQNRLFGEPYPRQEMAVKLQQDPFVGAIMTQALASRSWPLAARTFDNGLNDRIIKYYVDAVNALNSDQDEKTTFDALAAGVAQVLSQYGLAAQQ
jgi:multiple sugar transport system substrate-binding protein